MLPILFLLLGLPFMLEGSEYVLLVEIAKSQFEDLSHLDRLANIHSVGTQSDRLTLLQLGECKRQLPSHAGEF